MKILLLSNCFSVGMLATVLCGVTCPVRGEPSLSTAVESPSVSAGSEPNLALPAAPAPLAPPPAAPAIRAPSELRVENPANNDGLLLQLFWTLSPDDGTERPLLSAREDFTGYALLRSTSADGPFAIIDDTLAPGTKEFADKVTPDPVESPPADAYFYKVAVRTSETDAVASELHSTQNASKAASDATEGSNPAPAKDALKLLEQKAVAAYTVATPIVAGRPQGACYHDEKIALLALIVAFGALVMYFTQAIQKGRSFFIRRIPGIDAIEEAIGRSTEMGRPILYVPGIQELQDIQTIASMLILGRIAEIVAQYESDMVVPCSYPMVREVADEVVRAGYFTAGRPDAYDPRNVRFISSEQFAFCAGTNGIILRERPAANIFLGCFYAESLIFAETGFISKAIQIAGTAELSQLPFFIVSCDYTVIGEELFAVSAYLSRDPRLVSSLRASDVIRLLVIVSILVGTILSTAGYTGLVELWTPGSE